MIGKVGQAGGAIFPCRRKGEIGGRRTAIFKRPVDKGRLQSGGARRRQIAMMCRHQAKLGRGDIERGRRRLIGSLGGFVGAGDFGSQNGVLGQPRMARHGDQQSDMTLRASDDGETPLQADQSGDAVGPGVEPMPSQHQRSAIIDSQCNIAFSE